VRFYNKKTGQEVVAANEYQRRMYERLSNLYAPVASEPKQEPRQADKPKGDEKAAKIPE